MQGISYTVFTDLYIMVFILMQLKRDIWYCIYCVEIVTVSVFKKEGDAFSS
jgi:hypothetical protein